MPATEEIISEMAGKSTDCFANRQCCVSKELLTLISTLQSRNGWLRETIWIKFAVK